MAYGTLVEHVGRIERHGTHYVLVREQEDHCFLDIGLLAGWRARRLVGKQVRIRGVRVAHNVMRVKGLWPA